MSMTDLIQLKFLKQIKEGCSDKICPSCPLCGEKLCLLREPPEKWDCEDIFDKIQELRRN
jgi:predicted nucleic acid binding AN1-type Zn finger protein